MGPRERRHIRRVMIIASVLVALMAAVTLWNALQNAGRGPTPGSEAPGASSGGASATQ